MTGAGATRKPRAESSVQDRISRIERGLVVDPAEQGTVGQAADLLGRMAQLRVPGVSVAVCTAQGIEWARGYGVVGAGRSAPVTEETLFQAASISKPVTALGALRLVERGLLDLDGDVNDRLTSWQVPALGVAPRWRPRLTLRQLLSHTAGLTMHGFPGYRTDERLPSLTEVLNGAPPANTAPIGVDTLPGLHMRYSGGGYCVVQQLMEDVAGAPFADLMRELVLAPAGMARSTYAQPLPQERWSEAASAHLDDGSAVPGGWHVYPELAPAGLWTTPRDLARFALAVLRALRGGEGALLSAALAREMLTVQGEGPAGLGPMVAGDGDAGSFSHGGSNAGFKCTLRTLRDGRLGYAVMTNGDGGAGLTGLGGAIEREYGVAMAVPGAPPSGILGPTPEAYAGEYEVRPGYRLHVAVEDGEAVLLAPGQAPLPLQRLAKGRYAVPRVQTEVTFVDEQDGVPAGIVLRQNERDTPAKRLD